MIRWLIRLWKYLRGDAQILPIKIDEGEFLPGTRYVGKINGNNYKVVIVEVPPGTRIVNSDYHLHALYFPYTYFMIHYVESITPAGKGYAFVSLSAGFRSTPALCATDIIHRLPLGNYNGAFSVCLGSHAPRGAFKTLRELCESAITVYWRTKFEYVADWEQKTVAKSFSSPGDMIARAAMINLNTNFHDVKGKNQIPVQPKVIKPKKPKKPLKKAKRISSVKKASKKKGKA